MEWLALLSICAVAIGGIGLIVLVTLWLRSSRKQQPTTLRSPDLTAFSPHLDAHNPVPSTRAAQSLATPMPLTAHVARRAEIVRSRANAVRVRAARCGR